MRRRVTVWTTVVAVLADAAPPVETTASTSATTLIPPLERRIVFVTRRVVTATVVPGFRGQATYPPATKRSRKVTLRRAPYMTGTKPDTPPHVHESIELPPEPRSAAAARHFVEDSIADAVPQAVADVAVLLTSELVTNVIVHARTPLRVDVDVEPESVRVAVADDVPRTPMLRRSHDARLTGRGMNLVETLAAEWGVEPTPPGKTVWFELPA